MHKLVGSFFNRHTVDLAVVRSL